MKISNSPPPPLVPMPESAEPKGTDRKQDHDADDAGAAGPVAATPQRGLGTVIDTKA